MYKEVTCLLRSPKHSIPVNYADNNTLCAKGETLGEALERVRQDTEAAIQWFDNNKMQANPIKFQYMHNSKTEDIVFECKDIQIQADEIAKLLGIDIDNMLKFTEHVTGVIKKCEFLLNTVRRHSKLLNTKTKLLIFHSFIQANLNYYPLIWINRNRTDMKYTENVQKRALRIVFNDRISDYSDLLKKANTCTIKTRWKRQLITEIYKAVNGLTPSYISDRFQENTVNYNLKRSKLITQPKFSLKLMAIIP